MQLNKTQLNHFIKKLDEDRQKPIKQLRNTIVEHLPSGFSEQVTNDMIHYTVPLETYPQGYHCTKNTALPFASIASKKNFIVLHHIGIYFNKEILHWLQKEYPNYSRYKLNMGKGCIRFRKIDAIPYPIIALLMEKITVIDFIDSYEKLFKK